MSSADPYPIHVEAVQEAEGWLMWGPAGVVILLVVAALGALLATTKMITRTVRGVGSVKDGAQSLVLYTLMPPVVVIFMVGIIRWRQLLFPIEDDPFEAKWVDRPIPGWWVGAIGLLIVLVSVVLMGTLIDGEMRAPSASWAKIVPMLAWTAAVLTFVSWVGLNSYAMSERVKVPGPDYKAVTTQQVWSAITPQITKAYGVHVVKTDGTPGASDATVVVRHEDGSLRDCPLRDFDKGRGINAALTCGIKQVRP